MGRRYSVAGGDNVGSNDATLNMSAGGTRRPAIYDVIVGVEATPSDTALKWQAQRTTVGSQAGSAVTPALLDDADSIANSTAMTAHTVQPTYVTGVILEMAMNSRSTQRWVASPGGGLFISVTAGNGIAMRVQVTAGAALTGVANTMFHFEE